MGDAADDLRESEEERAIDNALHYLGRCSGECDICMREFYGDLNGEYDD